MALRIVAFATGVLATAGVSDKDVGYNRLFETANDEFDNHCQPSKGKTVPKWLHGGSFVIGSVGQQEMGDRHFVGYLDAFGKYTRYTVKDGEVCATYRMMRTGFYNNSVKANTIAPDLLFYETEPPRHCPIYDPICNLPPVAPNDNTFVNTFMHDGQLLSVTDAPYMLTLDPVSLNVTGTKQWKDDGIQGHVAIIGSAHPEVNWKYNEIIDFVGNQNVLTGSVDIVIYGISADHKDSRKQYGKSVPMSTVPYMHSYGVSDRYTILPRMPIKFGLPIGKMMAAAFTELTLTKPCEDNAFFIVPMDGGEVIKKFLPIDEKLYYTHTVNAFEVPEKNEVVIDLVTTGFNAFASDLTTKDELNKTFRDECYSGAEPCLNMVKRFHIPLGDEPIRTEIISDTTTKTDFSKMNYKFHSKSHCFYWAVEWFGDHKTKAYMSVVKYDLCSGGDIASTKKSWHKDNWYPSEASMIANPDKEAAEDDGVMVFIALDGASEQTFLVTVNASTMEEISMSGPFAPVAFTTHGEWFENMVPSTHSSQSIVV